MNVSDAQMPSNEVPFKGVISVATPVRPYIAQSYVIRLDEPVAGVDFAVLRPATPGRVAVEMAEPLRPGVRVSGLGQTPKEGQTALMVTHVNTPVAAL